MIAVRGADTHRNWRSAPPTAIIRSAAGARRCGPPSGLWPAVDPPGHRRL